MNGRIYDPLLGRFLSADLVVNNPADLQSFNRYSYVRNNPLSLTDPSGFTESDADKKKREEAEQQARDAASRARADVIATRCLGAFALGLGNAQINAAGISAAPPPSSQPVVFRRPNPINTLNIAIDPDGVDDEVDSTENNELLEDRNDGVETAEDSGGPTCAIAHDSKGEITEITVFVPASPHLRDRVREAKSAHENGDYSDMQIPLADLSGSVVAFGVTKAAETATAYGDDAAKVAGLSRASYALGKASLAFSVWGTVDGLVEGGGGPRAVVQAAVSTAIIGFSVSPPPLPLISIGLSAANLFLGDYFYRQVDEAW